MFLKAIPPLFFLLSFPLHHGNAKPSLSVWKNRIILEANDAGEEVSVTVDQYHSDDSNLESTSFYDFKKTFQEVSAHLTPTLEQAYDVFVMVNAKESLENTRDYIPPQFMRILRKRQPSQKVFIRDSKNIITGVHKDVPGEGSTGAFEDLPGLIPISSGAGYLPPNEEGQYFVDTPSGIYRININKSIERRFQKDIYNGLYFDLIYPSGLASGLAIHGTEEINLPFLGFRQSSHGCIRTNQNVASILYETLMSQEFMVEDLPDMDQRKRLKSELRDKEGQIVYRPGSSTLFIIFYGYEKKPLFLT